MTSSMKVRAELTCVGHQPAEGAQFQSSCKLCRESHRTQVWLCFLALSLLSSSVAHGMETRGVQACVTHLKKIIEKSDALLYTPSIYEDEHCNNMSLKCYLCELIMVFNEEEIGQDCITLDKDHLFPEEEKCDLSPDVGCLPCEAHPLQNITTFLDSLNNFLQKMNTIHSWQN